VKIFPAIAITSIVIVVTSCVEEKCHGCIDAPNDSLLCISFSGDYIGHISKASSSIIPQGIQTSIFAYKAGDNPATKSVYPGTPIVATSDSAGNLIQNAGTVLFMPAGEYDFYSVSANSSYSTFIKFSEGISMPLINGKDYLWAVSLNTPVNTNTDVFFLFRHIATAIKMKIIAGEGVESVHVKNIRIGQSKDSILMKLSDGIIVQATKLDEKMAEMIIEQNVAIYLMLPLSGGISIPVELHADIDIGGIVRENTYTAVIKSPLGGFESGTMYNYVASIESEGIIFPNATVSEWDDEIIHTIYINE